MIDLKAKPFFLSDEDAAWVNETLASMTFDEKVGQLFCPIGISDGEAYLVHLARELHIGGILFRENEGAKVQRAHRVLQRNSRIALTGGPQLSVTHMSRFWR